MCRVNILKRKQNNKLIRVSIVVSISACHAGDPGSIPGLGDSFFFENLSQVFTFQKETTLLHQTGKTTQVTMTATTERMNKSESTQ